MLHAQAMVGLFLSVVLVAGYDQVIDRVDRAAALNVFRHRVEEYAALHRRLEGPLPPLTPTRETLKNYVARQLLANAIRKARPYARQGDIFSPDVAFVFRATISDASSGRDVNAWLADLNAEGAPNQPGPPIINEPLARGASHAVPVALLHALPELPEDVEYRIVNRDLVLWDIHANLVVDFIPNAFYRVELTFLQRGDHATDHAHSVSD